MRIERWLLVGLALALASAPGPALEAEELLHGQGVLWRVERGDAAPSHLFGTIHVTDPRVLDLPRPVEDALERAESVAFELVMSEEDRVRLAEEMILAGGRTLEGILGSALFEKTAAVATEYGFSREELQRLAPWALVTVVSFPPAELARAQAGQPSLDEWLQQEARRLGKRIYALESAEEQLAVFNGMPMDEQLGMLRYLLGENDEVKDRFEAIVRDYLARDLASIHAEALAPLADEDPALAEPYERRFIDARNGRMVERALALLEEGNAFIAVGALHLPGENGILHRLEGEGYKVTPIY